MPIILKLALLCDFDGTITTLDTAEQVLKIFGTGDWEKYDIEFSKGNISLEECLSLQFSLVKTPPTQILIELSKFIVLRSNFNKLISYCDQRKILFVIVSAGIDFIIQYFLKNHECYHKWKIIMPKSDFSDKGYSFTFPRIADRKARDFKEECVLKYQKNNYHVIFIGDSRGDFNAIEHANIRFTIRNSSLAYLCKSHEIEIQEFDDFLEIIQGINHLYG